MALKRPLASLPTTLRTFTCTHCRHAHRLNAPTPRIPQPTPFVPDVRTFLTLIGRNLSTHAPKIPTWEALFSLSGAQLKESGIEPARARRYLLWWRDRFRNGIIGLGGDLTHVRDGVAELRIVEVPSARSVDQAATLTKDRGMRKIVVNVPPSLPLAAEASEADGAEEGKDDIAALTAPMRKLDAKDAKMVNGVRIVNGTSIGGKCIEYPKGTTGVALLKVREGLWEQKRGHKVDGGERRRAEVRAKRRIQERKNAR